MAYPIGVMLKKKQKSAELDLLAEKEKALKEEVQRLEQYIHGGAEKELSEHINTMPAPDELAEKKREAVFVEQVLSRKEVRNVRRHQAKGFILFLLLLLAIASLLTWAYSIYSGQ